MDSLTSGALAELMRKNAGVNVDPETFAGAPDTPFEDYGLDSLGLLGIVATLENQYGRPMPQDAERCRTPREFLALVNDTLLKSGA
ncbi:MULTISPECIES: acyl carrier protein [Streptomyces]|uniref:Acyl carrier protein n=1 Tax=Streptomyces tsukubensis (strain DSM 42081 / NBRC 108919 / NRRL 18488 / 9993) TaxID=1114943 RepID=I2N8P1_STRT9|nr:MULTISPECIES: acyl carrier protein [Streptomyces]AZK97257.1 curamycin polyketide synthase [Streptomyces tsukubensis]EIF93388.1 acyl carrier protein [Streptomyces tsukubensis NRRL18488]MYS65766.1 acyl carrier protein [Streptomyces sp. SID5473]QKM66777.1 acyl carrier protein [Streptomyces tsukubensis NRRL18488]TAI44876.1 acyl carrier protein [Streptomyces tsukubensis]